MFGEIIFGLAVVLLYSTAGPLLYLRRKVTEVLDRSENKLIQTISKVINCPQCSSFYLGLFVYVLYPFLPQTLIYAVILCALTTLGSFIYYKIY